MSRSSQSSRSTSSYPEKMPLSCQSDPKQRPTYDPRYDSSRYDPRYASTLSEPRSGYSSTSSSSSKSSRSSKSGLVPLSISRGSRSGESGSSKNDDERYYPSSFLDSKRPEMPEKKPLSCQTKDRDPRYYQNSSYYR